MSIRPSQHASFSASLLPLCYRADRINSAEPFLRSHLENALFIPLNALVETQDGRSVYVVRSDSTAEQRVVTLGEASSELMVEVAAGIQPGDRVIVKGQHDLVTGENVKVTEVLKAGDIGGES